MAQQCVNKEPATHNALVSDSYSTRIRIVSCLLFSTLIKASLKLEQPERNSQALSFLGTRKQGMKHSVPDVQSVFLRPTEKSCIPRFYNTESLKLDPEFANHDAVSPNLAPILFRTSEDRRNMSWKSFRIFNV